ncbi:MAG: WS/DGAT domain-containing protein, partial [Nocardioidaceae bacterium]
HAIAARVAATFPTRSYHVLIANVPGSQFRLYAAGATLLESYPALPLLPGHALAIGATSYDGNVFFGLTGDRDAVNDLDVLVQCLEEALDELVDASSPSRARAPRGRKPRARPTRP